LYFSSSSALSNDQPPAGGDSTSPMPNFRHARLVVKGIVTYGSFMNTPGL
jgi:hypothetical protein